MFVLCNYEWDANIFKSNHGNNIKQSQWKNIRFPDRNMHTHNIHRHKALMGPVCVMLEKSIPEELSPQFLWGLGVSWSKLKAPFLETLPCQLYYWACLCTTSHVLEDGCIWKQTPAHLIYYQTQPFCHWLLTWPYVSLSSTSSGLLASNL